MAKLVHFIDTLPGAPYTESNLQASEVRKCRANRPRSRHCNRQNGCRQPGCPPKLQRTFVLREKEPSPTVPRHLAGLFFGVNFAEPSSTQILAGIVFRFRGTDGRPFSLVRLLLGGP